MKNLGLLGLFTRGLPIRIVMIGTLTAAQWVIYDAFKVAVGLYVLISLFLSNFKLSIKYYYKVVLLLLILVCYITAGN